MKNNFQNIIKPPKIIFYFLLVVVLPCIVLGTLAFRGISNDQALIRNKHLKEVNIKGEELQQKWKSAKNNLINDILLLTENIEKPSEEFFNNSKLESKLFSDPLIIAIFYFDEEGLYFLKSSFYFEQENINLSYTINYPVKSDKLDNAWIYEFQDSDYKKAILLYDQLIESQNSNELALQALIGKARIYKKISKPEMAIQTYLEALKLKPGNKNDTQLLMYYMVQIELSRLFFELNKFDDAAINLINLYKELFDNYPSIPGSTIEFLYDHIITIQDRLLRNSIKPQFQEDLSHYLDLATHRINVNNLLLSAKKDLRAIFNEVNQPFESQELQEKLSFTNLNSFSCAIANTEANSYWGIFIDKQRLIAEAILPQLEMPNIENQWIWNILNDNGEFLLPNKKITYSKESFRTELSSIEENLELHGFKKSSPLFMMLFQSEKGIYFLIFILIGVILITGFLIIIYLINRELQLNKLKSDLVATVSHEFKSPLTAIRQIAEMFQTGRVPNDKKQQYYGLILREGNRLTHLVDNLLDMARIEKGKKRYNFRPTNLKSMVENIVLKYQENPDHSNFIFSLNWKSRVTQTNIDQTAISQVLHNLLDNAIKYSGRSKRIDLEVFNDGDTIAISVKDFGIGISKHDRDKIYDRFYRIKNNGTSNIQGSGIGLTLVKKIMEAHNGKITVESKINEGSMFTIYLPIIKG